MADNSLKFKYIFYDCLLKKTLFKIKFITCEHLIPVKSVI
jgi:hypothetical protein